MVYLTLSDKATWQRKTLQDHWISGSFQAAGESQFTEDMSDAVSEADFSKVKHLGAWILPTENDERQGFGSIYSIYMSFE